MPRKKVIECTIGFNENLDLFEQVGIRITITQKFFQAASDCVKN